MVVKNNNLTTKKGCFLGQGHEKLTPAEEEVLFLLTNELLTPKQIQIRRGCSQQAVNKILQNLKKKGAYNPSNKMVVKNQCTIQPNSGGVQPKTPKVNQIRLHGQEWNIKILFKDYKYKKIQENNNTIELDGNTVRLYKDSIEIYSGHSFYASDAQKATGKSFVYWNRFFARLEHHLKVILIKDRCQNINLVNNHYAEINNELAEESEKRGYKIRVSTTEDNKIWFTIDNSFNLHEAETQHPQTAKRDMEEVVKPFFNDLRDNNHYLPSEIKETLNIATKKLDATISLLHEIAHTQLSLIKTIDSQAEILKSLLPQKETSPEIKTKEKADYIG
jgi:DNA-binding CsgD family transcriptional regulator